MDKTDCGADKQNNSRRIRRRKKPGQQEDCSDSASAQIITNNDTGNFAGLDKKELLVELENHRIFLERRDPSFQRAKFFCRLCEVLLKSPQDCVQHLRDGRHQRKQDPWAESVSEISSMINNIELPASYKVYDQIRRVEHMPEPSRQHVTALDTVVERVCQQHGLSSAQLLLRQDTTSRLQKFLSAFRDGMTLHLYGSSLTGFGLTDSDVDISVAGSGLPSKLLLDAFNTLYQHGGDQYEEVHSDFNSTIPKVLVTDTKSGLQLRLTANTGPSVLTSKLLRIYSLADPRVTPLTIAFRCWAKMCQLDMPEEGSLPAVAFSIMVVYFLQQVEPSVLPVMPLPEPQPEGKGTIPMKMEDRVDFQALKSQALAWQSDNRCSVGDLWLQLLKFYCLHFDYTHVVVSLRYAKVLTRLEKKWHAKKFTVEDPFSVKRSISSTMSSFRMFEYYQSCLLTACEYFAVPRDFEAKTSSVHPVQLQTNQSAHSVLTDSGDASSMGTNTCSEADRDSQNGQAIHGKAHGVQKRETVCEKMHRTETDKQDEKGVSQHGQERADVMFRGQETTQDVSDKRQDTADDVSDEGQKRAEIGKDKEQESAEHLEEIAADVSDKGQEGAYVSDKGLESAEDVNEKGLESAEDVSDKELGSAEDVNEKGLESLEDVSDKELGSAEDVNEKGLESAEDVESAGDVSDKEQESAEDVNEKGLESAEDVSDKELGSAEDVNEKGLESAEDVSDKEQESAEDVSDKGQESAENVSDKGLESAEDVNEKGLESAEDVNEKGQESAEDVSDKGQESAEDVSDKGQESAGDVSDKGQESAEDVSDKGLESAEDVNEKGQESAEDVSDKGQESAEDVNEKGLESAEDVENAGDVSDKGLESDKEQESAGDVSDKEQESAADVSDKEQESTVDVSDKKQGCAADVSDKEQETAADVNDKGQESAADVSDKEQESADVSDKGQESAAGVSDKGQESAADVNDKEQESADVNDKEQESAADVSDKEQESADASDKGHEGAADVSDKGQESAADVNDKEQGNAADVSDKEQESADVSDKGQESAADVNDKEQESAADVSDKGHEGAADVSDKGQESAADVSDKGQESAADVSDKEQESADVSDRRHEGAEDVSDKEQEGEEDVSDGKQESPADVSDGTQEVATDVSDKGLKIADVSDKGQEGAEDVSDRKQESAADVSDGTQEIAADVSDKGLKIAGDPSDKEQESAADVSDKGREGTADVSVEGKGSAADVSDKEQEQANVNDKGLVSVAVSNKEQEMTGNMNDKGQERKDVSNKEQENADVSDKEPENADVSDREQERIEDMRVSAQKSGGIILAAEQKRAEGVGMVEQSPEQCVLTTVCSGIAPCVRNEVLDSSFTAGTQAESPKVVKQTEEHLLLEEQNRQDLRVSQAEDDQKFTFVYKFTREVFTKGKGPVVMCVSCGKEGHIKTKCPADKAVPLEPLPPMTESHMVLLDTVVSAIVDDFSPDDTQKKQRQMIVGDIEYYLQRFFPGVSLSLFGSSCNGFGFASSDLDICMTFRGKNIQDVKVKQVMYKLAWALKEAASLCREVVCIPHAKVPIVKFTHSVTGLQGDISLFNTLAIRNTHLLRCYSDLDLRVMKLGYAIKVFAKVCNIGDKSKGSLSSYAYIVMMLHYLQQVSPPVIPVLQEMYQGERPQHMVEGWNTWFYENLKKMREVWPDYGKNTQSVGELWLGFFRYYVEHFDWKGTVVTIRQKAVLTKFEKMWTGKAIVVEDPFDLNHNLAVGLSQSMNDFIFKAFVNARTHFGTPVELRRELFSLFNSPADYFFEELLLKRGVSCLSKVRRKLKGAAKTPKEKTLKKEKPGKGQDDGSMVQDASSPAGQDSLCPESQDASSVAGQDADSLASQNSHSPAGQGADSLASQNSHNPAGQGADSLAEQGPDSPVGQVADSPAGQCPHLPTGQSADSPAGQGAHSPYGQGADRPVGQSTTNHIIQSQVFFNRTSSVPYIDPDLTSEDAQNRGTLTDDAGTLTSTSLTDDLDTQTAIGLTDDRDTLTATAMTVKSPMSLEEMNPTLLEGMTPEELVLTPQVQMAMFGSPFPGMESASSTTLLSGRQSISETHLQSVSAMSSLLSQLPPSTSHSGMHDPEHTLFPHGQPVYPSASTQACVSAHSQPGRPLPSALAAVHHTGAGGCQKETPPPGSPTTGQLQQQQLKYGARRGKRREKQNFQHCQKQAMNASNTAVSKKGPTSKPASESPVPVAPVRGNPAPLKSRTDSTRSKQPDRGNPVSLKSRTDSARSKQRDRGNPVSLKAPADSARSKQPDRGNAAPLKSPTDSARSKQPDRGNPVSLKSPTDSARSKQPDRGNPVSLKSRTDSARSKQRDRGNPVSLKSPADSARSKQPDHGNPVSLKSPTDSARSKRPDRGNPVSLKSPTDCALSKQPDRGNPVSLKSPTDSARSKQPGKGDLVL